MPHMFFLSYASENWNQPGLEDFYNDLCNEIAPNVPWKHDDPNISFRDHNMRLGEVWKPEIARALDESVVLVCIVSAAYFTKPFCGQEFYIFDQRRRQGLAAGEKPPDVVLPVVWAPVAQGVPKSLGDLQADQAGMGKDYFAKGLRRLKTLDRDAYTQCVAGLADAIVAAWQQYSVQLPYGKNAWACKIPPGPALELGPSVPNEFARGDWREAAGPNGWFEGPSVANFVFGAGVKTLIPKPRYGEMPGHWQPYLPPSLTTVAEYAVQAVRKLHNFKYREIALSENIEDDLQQAKQRKNLTVLVADPQSLALAPLSSVRRLDELAWEGTAVLLPCDDQEFFESQAVQNEVQRAFPKHIAVAGASYPGRIPSADELEHKLDVTLSELHSAVVKSLTKSLPVTDAAPAQITTAAASCEPMKVTPRSLNLPPQAPARGRVITFYSYKGGTGRSMALVNVAWMLALNGERVLVIDWDLEAPGLHRYFHPFIKDKELADTPGLLDFVEKQAAMAAVAKDREQQAQAEAQAYSVSTVTSIFKGYPQQAIFKGREQQPQVEAQASSAVLDVPAAEESAIIDYIVPLVWPNGAPWSQFGSRSRIDLIPAGRQVAAYGRTLSAFNWIDFFERLEGRKILQAARDQLRSVYDYILIDSRTGVSDTSGICTVEMPDTLVICFTLNDQSIIGASGITESIRSQIQKRQLPSPAGRSFSIFPIPMRVEITGDQLKRQVGLQFAQSKFSAFLGEPYKTDLAAYWGSAQMAYYPYYAFEEIPSVFGDLPNDDYSLTASVKKITAYLTDQTITTLPALDTDGVVAEKKRKEILSWFTRKGVQAPAAQAVYDQLSAVEQPLLLLVLQRLIQVDARGQDSVRRCAVDQFPAWLQPVVRRLADPRLLGIAKSPDGAETVYLTDPEVLEKWELLRRVIQENRTFLVWRQGLAASVNAWLAINRDPSALWRGKLVEEAEVWQKQRLEELNQVEQEFVTQSIEQAKKEERMASLASALEVVAVDQKRWSLTANQLKASIQSARLLTFGLTVGGAILETLAAQQNFIWSVKVSEIIGYSGAAALACVVVVKSLSLSRERQQGWLLARAAAEALKREMYFFRTLTGPYVKDATTSPDAMLFQRRDDILSKVTTVRGFAIEPDPATVKVGAPLDAQEYISERVLGQIGWYKKKADQYAATQNTWSNVEYLLAIAGALLGAALTATHNQAFGAWIAVITTISGAVGAHVLSERYDQITISYRATADRLTSILGRWRATPGQIGLLVEQVEATLLEENQAWIAGADEVAKQLVSSPAPASSKTA